MSTKPSINNSDSDRQPIAEPTKYIIHCCELRKRRNGKPPFGTTPERIRITVR
jgi:hypothetical protein